MDFDPILARSPTFFEVLQFLLAMTTAPSRFCWDSALRDCRLKGLKTSRFEKYCQDMLWTIAIILLILWLLGFSFHVGGGLIHLVLVIVVIVVIIRLVTGRGV
jgi:hypothetical protein